MLKMLYAISLVILFSAIVNVSSNNVNSNKENSTNNSTQTNDAKADISSIQIFCIVVAVLSLALIILWIPYCYWVRKGNKMPLLCSRRHRRVGPNIVLEDREQQRKSRTESWVGPSGEHREICKPEHKRKNKHGRKWIYKSKSEKTEQSRHQYKHKNKLEDEEWGEIKDQQQDIWHTNVRYVSDEDIKVSVVPTLVHSLSKSAKTSASSRPGPSSSKSSGSSGANQLRVSAVKVIHAAEVYATKKQDDW